MNSPSFLIIILRRIGDVLLATPLIHSIRVAYPDAHIATLVFKGTGGILAGNPDINTVHEIPAKMDWGLYKTFWREHGRSYDWAISTQPGDRPTLFALLAGKKSLGPRSTGHDKNWWRRLLLSHCMETPASAVHVVPRYLSLCDALNIPKQYGVVPPATPETDIAHILGFAPTEPYVVCHPIPMFPYKRWADTQWRKLIRSLLQRGQHVVISGGHDKAEQLALTQLLGDMAGQVTNLAGKTSFAELAEVLRSAQHFYGTDTSVTHLAAATGIPITAIFGPTNPQLWGPWPQGVKNDTTPWQPTGPIQRCGNITIVQSEMPCVPCQLEGCDKHINSHSQCLENILAENVL
jgi:heptosyltransferase-3